MELRDGWRAAPADDHLRRAYPVPEFDDTSWEPIRVPAHWRSTPAFASLDGPLLHRLHFESARPADGRRSWLIFDGVFYQADVWLDGSYVGDPEGYFFPHTYEITADLREREEHLLAVEVACARPTDRRNKRNLTGVFQHWDCIDPDWNPGGIWQPVRIEETGPVRISRMRAISPEASPERAVLAIRVVLDAVESTTVLIRTTVEGAAEHHQVQPVAAGENRLDWEVFVEQPALWWPHALGHQHLHDVTVEVSCGDEVSDRTRVKTGLRQVRLDRWILSVNSERIFIKGSNQGPARMDLAEATPEALERDVVLAKDAGLDLLRVHGHVSRPELYDAADRHGMLVWQDLPLQWGYARGLRKQAARQAREAVERLGHHPSIALWCGHNEPFRIDVAGDSSALLTPEVRRRYLASQVLPSWNKTILDRTIRRALERSDSSRPVVPHSGVLPGPFSGGTDSHLYFGWYHGRARDLEVWAARWPRLFRFVSELGAQAVPDDASFCEPERWPDLDWERLERTHNLQKALFDERVPPAAFDTFAAWRAATQAYQATMIRRQIESLRRLKYRPTGGFCQFSFADTHPSVSWSVLDHERRPKEGYAALVAACAPVIVVADRLPERCSPGDAIALDVHVVSDLRFAIAAAEVRATLTWNGGSHAWHWTGEVPPDSCTRVGTVSFVVPDAPGPLSFTVTLDSPTASASNHDDSSIA